VQDRGSLGPAGSRRKSTLDAFPSWMLAPAALDYVSPVEVLTDDLWLWHAFTRHLDRIEEWTEPRGLDLADVPVRYPRLPEVENGP
jgi:hypothetical protein